MLGNYTKFKFFALSPRPRTALRFFIFIYFFYQFFFKIGPLIVVNLGSCVYLFHLHGLISLVFSNAVSDLVFEANIWIHKNSFWVNLGL